MFPRNKIRLDSLLVHKRLYSTRSRARDAILRLCVLVEGNIVSKPGSLILPSAKIEINDQASRYVSRSAIKLAYGLQISGFTPQDRICLDIGASTGGFSQVLLEQGAAHVFALDVGHGQLEPSICNNSRVSELSSLNSRDLTIHHLNNIAPEFLVADVSFISLKLALPRALTLAIPSAKGVFLIKPQFEAGRSNIGKGGMVCNAQIGTKVAQSVCDWLDSNDDWQVHKLVESPIKGANGNREYIVAASKACG